MSWNLRYFTSREMLTYGWAILFAVFLISILSSLGFLPRSSIEERAYVGPPFRVLSEKIEVTGVTLELLHEEKSAIDINSLSISNCGVNEVSRSVSSETPFLVRVDCSSLRGAGDIFDEDIFIVYSSAEDNLLLNAGGKIYGVVERN